jgi:hypothetical protein
MLSTTLRPLSLALFLVGCGGSPSVTTAPVPRVAEPAAPVAPATPAVPASATEAMATTEATGCPLGVEPSESWPGEYPSPVVQIVKDTALPIVTIPCGAPVKRVCTVAPRFLHPWAKPASRYLTVQAVQTWRVKAPMRLSGGEGDASIDLKTGELVQMTTPLSEGFCAFRYQGKRYDDQCPDDARFEAVPGPAFPTRQLAEVACKEGGTGFVVISPELLTVDGVREGTIVEYGVIGPAAP